MQIALYIANQSDSNVTAVMLITILLIPDIRIISAIILQEAAPDRAVNRAAAAAAPAGPTTIPLSDAHVHRNKLKIKNAKLKITI